MKNMLLPALALVSTLSACKKDAPEASLPAATQVGANTGGCLLNGQPFAASSYGGGLLSNPIPALFGGFSYDSIYYYYLQINGKIRGNNTSVTLFFRSQQVGLFVLDKKTQYYPQVVAYYALDHATYSVSDNQNEVYVTDAQHTGKIELTYANVQQHISAGTFEFTAVSNLDPSKTVTITSGRFDRKQ